MGLHKQYFKVGQNARNQLFGNSKTQNGTTPLSMLISHGVKLNNNRIAVICFGILTLIAGVLLSSIPWLDYFILKNLRLWNNSLSFHYWQRPGVIRFTKVYIFNVTNPDGFLNGEKPKLNEIGPFVYREDMQKVNIKFHDNFTVTYQHKKILEFIPELSVDPATKITTPNIPLLTLTGYSNQLGFFLSKTVSLALSAAGYKPFVSITADDLVFGYDDTLVTLAHKFYPKNRRPQSKMGLLIGRNGTLTEFSSIHTGHNGMDKFGYLAQLNGLNSLPYWQESPCNNIAGSEGSFFPPRDYTKADTVFIYDKDLCRIVPLVYKEPVIKDGINADLFVLPEDAYGNSKIVKENKCYDMDGYSAPKGLQNISPCQYGAPIFISNPHFYQSDSNLLSACEGLEPKKELHESYFKIQPKFGVPLEGLFRAQINFKVDRAENIESVANFRDFMFPIMWVEEGVSDLTPEIRRWIYLGTVFAPIAIPILAYGMIITGAITLIYVFVRAYQRFVFASDPTIEILEMGRRSIRRGSSFIASQQRMLMHRESYVLLKENSINNDINSNNV